MNALVLLLVSLSLLLLSSGHGDGPFASEGSRTRVTIRVVSRGAKVIGTGVGGARVTVVDQKTGKVLVTGIQQGGTGDTREIMQVAHRITDPVYSTGDSAHFTAEMPLSEPTPVEVIAEGPLGIPHAVQRASKSFLVIPGFDILGEGIVIELSGLIVELLSPGTEDSLKAGQEVPVSARVRML